MMCSGTGCGNGGPTRARWLSLRRRHPTDLFDDPDVLAGLSRSDSSSARPRTASPSPRRCGSLPDAGDAPASIVGECPVLHADGGPGSLESTAIDAEAGEVDLSGTTASQELGEHSPLVMLNDWVWPQARSPSAVGTGRAVLDPTSPSPRTPSPWRCSVAICPVSRRTRPDDGLFTDDVDDDVGWAPISTSYRGDTGPPGNGKTFRGAHIVRALIEAGKRVGITAMSHHAIDNLLEASRAGIRRRAG